MEALEVKHLAEQKRADRLEFEGTKLQDQVSVLQKEKQVRRAPSVHPAAAGPPPRHGLLAHQLLLREKAQLQHQVDELRAGDFSMAGVGGLEDMEKLIRLQHEVEVLRAQQSGTSDEQVRLALAGVSLCFWQASSLRLARLFWQAPVEWKQGPPPYPLTIPLLRWRRCGCY